MRKPSADFQMEVSIGQNSLEQLNKFLSGSGYSKIFILTDTNCLKNCLPVLKDEISALKHSIVIAVQSGEENKSFISAEKVLNELHLNHADRNSLLINLGGGMITDLGGFAASVFKRGIHFVNVPTSLMGMVDASIGGKTGVNLNGVKNMAGTFQLPEHVFIYPEFLKTLPERELKSAYSEIIKHALLSDVNEWNKLVADPVSYFADSQLEPLIAKSVHFKESITKVDPREQGRRHILNLGHTYGHAIESLSHEQCKPLLHGEAIAIGIIGELFLSVKLLNTPEAILVDALKVIRKLNEDIRFELNDELLPFLYHDKKNKAESIGFSLIHSPGKPSEIIFPQTNLIIEGIQFMQKNFSEKVPAND